MSRDPIGEDGGLNLYGMVVNNPLILWDFLGLDGCSDFVDQLLKSLDDTEDLAFRETPLSIAMALKANSKMMSGKKGDVSGFKPELVSGGQGSQVKRHVLFQAGAVFGGLFHKMAANLQKRDNEKEAKDPKTSDRRRAESETEVRDDEAGRRVGEHMVDYMDGNISRDQLRDKLMDELCDGCDRED